MNPGTLAKTDCHQLSSINRDQENYIISVNYFDLNNIKAKNITSNDTLNSIIDLNDCCGGGVVQIPNNILHSQHHGGPGYEYYPQGCVQSLVAWLKIRLIVTGFKLKT